jgi:hypothetical protein
MMTPDDYIPEDLSGQNKVVLINNTGVPVIASVILVLIGLPLHHAFLFINAYILLVNAVLYAIYEKPITVFAQAASAMFGMQLAVAFVIYLYGLMGF